MSEKIIEILLVDDSQVSRDLISYIISSDPTLKIIGYAENGEKALEFISNHRKPDVIITDIVMPKMDGFALTKKIMQTNPIPIIIMSGVYNHHEVTKSFQAITAGALTILEKPKGTGDKQYLDTARFVIETIKALGKIKLSNKKRNSSSSEASSISPSFKSPVVKTSSPLNRSMTSIKAVAIGATLGGPQALSIILSNLQPNFPIPIFIAQQLSMGFMQGLVNWLSETSFLKIQIAKNGEQAKPGTVYISPDKSSIEVNKDNVIRIIENNQNTSVNCIGRLFHSMAIEHGANGVGILLTGTGTDGPEELLLMKDRGAITIVQEKKTCVRADLPEQAIKLGAAQHVIPLLQIAETVEKIVDSKTVH